MLSTIKQGVALGWLFSAAWKEKSSGLLLTPPSLPLPAPTALQGKREVESDRRLHHPLALSVS